MLSLLRLPPRHKVCKSTDVKNRLYFSVILLYRANKDKKQVTTSCGHLFCNVCIIGALQSSLDECELDEKTKSTLLENIKLKLTQQAVKIRADIEVACYTYEGIDSVKDALKAGMAIGTEEVPIKINLIAPPLYVVTTSTPERQVSFVI